MTNNESTLRQYMHQTSGVSTDAFAAMMQYLEFKTIAKDEVFIKKDRTNNLEYFLLEGVCRSFLYNPDGDDITISFFQGPTVLSPYTIRTNGSKSLFDFQACTDLLVGQLDADAFLNLMIRNLEIREFGNAVLRNELIRKIDKEIGLVSLPARERLLKFREQYKMLENLVPHAQIASFLGITTISLSRLRGDIARE
jgi:CRP-like cAMP-binding protein